MLQSMDKPEIISLLFDMYDTKKEIKEYLDYVVSPNEKEQLFFYCHAIHLLFFKYICL